MEERRRGQLQGGPTPPSLHLLSRFATQTALATTSGLLVDRVVESHIRPPSAPSTCRKGTLQQKFRPFHTRLDDDERSGDFSNPRNSSGVSQREIMEKENTHGSRGVVSKDVTVQLVLNRRH